jgi:ABC-type bacteriocin/lantibiotic exporter with double-glycine peptidase domain
VAIARAVLKEAPVLILDDALSAVDAETETLILDALRARRGRSTTLVIAHRLSTIPPRRQHPRHQQGSYRGERHARGAAPPPRPLP